MAQQATFAIALQNIRKRLKLTQESFGEKIGVSRGVVANAELGLKPSRPFLQQLLKGVSEPQATKLRNLAESQFGIKIADGDADESEQPDDDMIAQFMSLRISHDVDLSGKWHAMWLTTVNDKPNRNREVITVRKRLGGGWQFSNDTISEENPDGGYLWVAKLELFDNRHLLGYYCARDRNVLAKGTLCLELQANGREIFGVWDGLSFDTMWAQGTVALCRTGDRNSDAGEALDRFMQARPKMPY